jgi:hypothetical protein
MIRRRLERAFSRSSLPTALCAVLAALALTMAAGVARDLGGYARAKDRGAPLMTARAAIAHRLLAGEFGAGARSAASLTKALAALSGYDTRMTPFIDRAAVLDDDALRRAERVLARANLRSETERARAWSRLRRGAGDGALFAGAASVVAFFGVIGPQRRQRGGARPRLPRGRPARLADRGRAGDGPRSGRTTACPARPIGCVCNRPCTARWPSAARLPTPRASAPDVRSRSTTTR